MREGLRNYVIGMTVLLPCIALGLGLLFFAIVLAMKYGPIVIVAPLGLGVLLTALEVPAKNIGAFVVERWNAKN